jgi:hypothetical protein
MRRTTLVAGVELQFHSYAIVRPRRFYDGGSMPKHPVDRAAETILLALQVLQVVFLWIHDWIPLGRLNDVAAVRSQDTLGRLVMVTFFQSVPWSIGLYFSALYFERTYPHWLHSWLWISYVVLLVGQIRAWWVPYLFRPDPQRAARYRIMFGNTHSFLPVRNGLVPNTAHIMLHACTVATLVVLFAMDQAS